MPFHPLLLLVLRCHFATSLISASPRCQPCSPSKHYGELYEHLRSLTLSSDQKKGAAFVPQLRVVLHPLSYVSPACDYSERPPNADQCSHCYKGTAYSVTASLSNLGRLSCRLQLHSWDEVASPPLERRRGDRLAPSVEVAGLYVLRLRMQHHLSRWALKVRHHIETDIGSVVGNASKESSCQRWPRMGRCPLSSLCIVLQHIFGTFIFLGKC